MASESFDQHIKSFSSCLLRIIKEIQEDFNFLKRQCQIALEPEEVNEILFHGNRFDKDIKNLEGKLEFLRIKSGGLRQTSFIYDIQTKLMDIMVNLGCTRFGSLEERLETTRTEYEIEELINYYTLNFIKLKNRLKDFKTKCSQFRVKELSEQVKRKRTETETPPKRRRIKST